MDFKHLDDETLLLLIEQTRSNLLETYRKYPSFLHPNVYRLSMDLDRLLEIFIARNK